MVHVFPAQSNSMQSPWRRAVLAESPPHLDCS